MSDEIYALEDADGIRMPFNMWPRSKVEALRCVLPFAAMYTPLKPIENVSVLGYEPQLCKGCGAALNPYATVDYNTCKWQCPLCGSHNQLPASYQGISAEQMPQELFPSATTVEYVLRSEQAYPPVFIFIVDTAVAEDELEACKSTLVQALQMMPEDAMIGLVTFGTHVHVHELLPSVMHKVYVFRGGGSLKAGAVASQLGLRARAGVNEFPARRFLVSLADAEFEVTQALEGLQPDAFPPVSDHRKSRCTGTAVQVAQALVAAALPIGKLPVRLMLFLGGPCTEGDAAIVSKELSKEIRSHKDLDKGAAPYWRPAIEFYHALRKQLVDSQHTLDVFACALEQSGIAEMKPALQASGGIVVQTDTFRNPVFKDSLARVFAGEADDGFSGRSSCALLTVICSADVKVEGMLGCGASVSKPAPWVSKRKTGEGGTCAWVLPALDYSSTACIVFEVSAEAKEDVAGPHDYLYMQFQTAYLHHDRSKRLRVTTVSRRWVSGREPGEILAGLDQEAAAVVLARLLTWKSEMEEDFDATRWLDRTLIRLCQRFAHFTKGDPKTFQLTKELAYFPGFNFHLRRSQFVQVFGNSPDETAFARLMLFKEHTRHCVLMIQPQLYRYRMREAPAPVELDVSSIQAQDVLFLDTFFYVVVFHGATVAQWRQHGYQEDPEHADFAQLLREPQEEAAAIVRTRFPVPRLVDADNHTVAGRSQSRFLLVKLNPSSTHASNGAAGEVILTDDVSFELFVDHLKTLAVQT